MPWFRVDDDLAHHPKARAASPYAMGVWLMCGAWVAKHLTDGWVPETVVREQGGRNWKRAAETLVRVGLWTPETPPRENYVRHTRDGVTPLQGPGYRYHDYLVYNPTRADVEAERERNAARQAALRARKRRPRNGVTPGGVAPLRADIDVGMRNAPPDPYAPSGRHGVGTRDRDARPDGTQTDHLSIDKPERVLRPGPEAAALLAAARERAAAHGRRVRGIDRRPPMDEPRLDGA